MAHLDKHAGATPALVAGDNDHSYVDWPAVLAGTVVATAISLVLLTFGSSLGLSLTSVEPGEGVSLFWLAVIAALWLLWVEVSSFLAGGYLTGRMRRRHGDATEHESDLRDGSNGLVMWAVGVLLGAAIAFWGIGGTISATTSAAGAAGTVVSQIADTFDADSLLVDRALRGGPAATGPVDPEIRSEVGRILLSTLGDGELDQGDRDYLVSIISARAGISQEEAGQRIDQIVEQGRQLEADVIAAAESARRVGVLAAFLAAAALLVSAVAAYFGAALGGKHRDEQTVAVEWYKPW